MIDNIFKNLMQSNPNSKVNIEELKEIPKLMEKEKENLKQAIQQSTAKYIAHR